MTPEEMLRARQLAAANPEQTPDFSQYLVNPGAHAGAAPADTSVASGSLLGAPAQPSAPADNALYMPQGADAGGAQAQDAGPSDFERWQSNPNHPSAVGFAQGVINGSNKVDPASEAMILHHYTVDSAGRINGIAGSGHTGPNPATAGMDAYVATHKNLDAERIKSIEAESAAMQKQNDSMAASAARLSEKADKLTAEQQTANVQQQQHQEKAAAYIDKQSKELSQMKVDPSRLVRDKGALLGIAAAFGSFGAAITHSRNDALDLITRSIDNDIDAQKTNIETKRQSISLSQQQYNNYRQQGVDDTAARLAVKANVLTAYAARQDFVNARKTNADEKGKAEQAVIDVKEHAAQLAMQASQLIAAQHKGVAPVNAYDYKSKLATQATPILKNFENPKTNGQGEIFDALKPGQQTRVNKALVKVEGLLQFRKQLSSMAPDVENSTSVGRRLADAGGVFALPTSDASERLANGKKQLAGALQKAIEGARGSDADAQRYYDQVGLKQLNTDNQLNMKFDAVHGNAARSAATELSGLVGSERAAAVQALQAQGLSQHDILRLFSGDMPGSAAKKLGLNSK